ncbi:MAG TPA: hypothetical protein VJB36_05335 [Methylomirabilota bacterium]|nr:hypothetical protein [Methylomirabilota bacterium]
MSDPWIVLAGIVVVAVGYVLLPVAYDAFLRFRGTRPVNCPETGARAEVDLDARGAALTAMFRHPTPRVERCSEWPDREGCEERCVAEAAPSKAAHARVP